MNIAKIEIVEHGPAASHNMPCPVCRIKHAVLDLTSGIMHPCWDCQNIGYEIVLRNTNWLGRQKFERLGMNKHR